MSANRHRELALTEAYDWSAFCDQLCQTILFQMHALSDVTPYTLKVLVGLGQMGLVANSALPNGAPMECPKCLAIMEKVACCPCTIIDH